MNRRSTPNFLYLALLFSFSVMLFFYLEKTYAVEFDNVSPISIIKEDGTNFEIHPTFIVEEGYKVAENSDVINDKVPVTRGEPIKISYKSPCGFPDSVQGLFLRGSPEMLVKSFSSTGAIQTLELTGEQKEFYNNSSPQKEGIETASIPNDIAAAELENDDVKNTDKLVFIVDCDEDKFYYVADTEVN
jgi:hypothetical protein